MLCQGLRPLAIRPCSLLVAPGTGKALLLQWLSIPGFLDCYGMQH